MMPSIEHCWAICQFWMDAKRNQIRDRVSGGGEVMIAAPSLKPLTSREQIAIISVRGVLTRTPVNSWFYETTALSDIQAAAKAVENDPNISGAIILIESPGGSANGSEEAALAIDSLARAKPTVAQVVGMAASAGYFLAAAAPTIYSSMKLDVIGSIGTIVYLYDWSRYFENAGVEPVVIATGSKKHVGVQGTEITEEHREMFKDMVDDAFNVFAGYVRKSRKLTESQWSKVSDARVVSAARAVDLKLIDGVQTLDATIAQLTQQIAGRGRNGVGAISAQTEVLPMAENTQVTAPTNQPATMDELKAALPNAEESFRAGCFEKMLTVPQATTRYVQVLENKAKAAMTEATANPPAKSGPVRPTQNIRSFNARGGESSVDPLDLGPTSDDPVEMFNSEVRQLVDKGVERNAAVKAVASRDPELHAAYIGKSNDDLRRVPSFKNHYLKGE